MLAADERMPVTVAGSGGSEIITLSPVVQAGGVQLAPIGLTGMLNAGGTVLRWAGGRAGRGREEVLAAGDGVWAAPEPCCSATMVHQVAVQTGTAQQLVARQLLLLPF